MAACGCGAVRLDGSACCVVLAGVDAGLVSDFCGFTGGVVLVADGSVCAGDAGNLASGCVGDCCGLAFAVCDYRGAVSREVFAIYFVAFCARIDWASG